MSAEIPTWEFLRANRWMVVDHDTLLLGLYPTEGGMVVLRCQLQGAQAPFDVTLCPDEVPLLCQQLVCAQGHAERQREANVEAAAAQTAYDLLTKMKEAAK